MSSYRKSDRGYAIAGRLLHRAKIIEYLSDGGSNSEGGYQQATSNGGSAVGIEPTNGDSAAYLAIGTGTATNGGVGWRTNAKAFNAANGEMYAVSYGVCVDALPDATNNYVATIGYSNSSAGPAMTAIAAFRIDRSQSATCWICETLAGAVPVQRTITTVPIKLESSGQKDKLERRIKDGKVRFYANGVQVAEHDTSIISGWAQAVADGIWILKSAGTTARNVYVDLEYSMQELINQRNLTMTPW